MDSVVRFLKNKWFNFAVSFFSIGYLAFTIWLVWLSFAFFLTPTNESALLILYIFINLFFGFMMVFTRKQLITQIVVCLTPLAVLALLILGFGNWYLIIPPLVICIVTFFAVATTENIKVIVGTIYLIMYVVGVLAYITLGKFNIKISDININERSDVYLISPNGTYRLVEYVSDQNKERVTSSFYIEETKKDMKLWFLDCYYMYNADRVLVTLRQNNVTPRWISDGELLIDGKIRKIPIEKRDTFNVDDDPMETSATT